MLRSLKRSIVTTATSLEALRNDMNERRAVVMAIVTRAGVLTSAPRLLRIASTVTVDTKHVPPLVMIIPRGVEVLTILFCTPRLHLLIASLWRALA